MVDPCNTTASRCWESLLWRCRLRTQCCCFSSSGCCCAAGLIPGLGIPHCTAVKKKKKDAELIPHRGLPSATHTFWYQGLSQQLQLKAARPLGRASPQETDIHRESESQSGFLGQRWGGGGKGGKWFGSRPWAWRGRERAERRPCESLCGGPGWAGPRQIAVIREFKRLGEGRRAEGPAPS